MSCQTILTSNKQSISIAASALKLGGTVAFPTDTVYGVGAIFSFPNSVDQLYKIKSRPYDKAIPVLVSSVSQLDLLAKNISTTTKLLIQHFWPGALTIVIHKHPSVNNVVAPDSTIAVRMPNHLWLLNLIEASGPLAVTSANKSKKPATNSYKTVHDSIGNNIDLLVKTTCHTTLFYPNTPSLASTIVDCTKKPPVVLREGPISKSEIMKTYNSL
ncbi:MAG TPA: threonylcarbamoyl-AMP synthase [Chloroflexi bacterium]|nr:threonylcarbamoyl-AMP synthase [Chloroflexota bacterium]|tara:strand:- start:243 stop:887 length:645 start_codon:yes stop_codon:yes gene_type:complete